MSDSLIRSLTKQGSLFIGIVLLLCSSCTRYYGNSDFMMAGVDRAGQCKLGAAVEIINEPNIPNGSIQAAYSPLEHFSIHGGISRSAKNVIRGTASQHNAGLGIGYYWQLKAKQQLSVSLGLSNSNIFQNRNNYITELKSNQAFVQVANRLSAGEKFTCTLATKLNLLDMKSLEVDGYIPDEDWETVQNYQKIDPLIVVETGIRLAYGKAKTRAFCSYTIALSTFFNHPASNAQIGLSYDLGSRRQTKQPK